MSFRRHEAGPGAFEFVFLRPLLLQDLRPLEVRNRMPQGCDSRMIRTKGRGRPDKRLWRSSLKSIPRDSQSGLGGKLGLCDQSVCDFQMQLLPLMQNLLLNMNAGEPCSVGRGRNGIEARQSQGQARPCRALFEAKTKGLGIEIHESLHLSSGAFQSFSESSAALLAIRLDAFREARGRGEKDRSRQQERQEHAHRDKQEASVVQLSVRWLRSSR